MSFPYDPDHVVHLSSFLREFVERWQNDPAAAIECATGGTITTERAQALLDGAEWKTVDVVALGFVLGPNPNYWRSLHRNYRDGIENGKQVVGRTALDGEASDE